MKSYLAKLAARATLANAPSSAATTSKTHDPFAEAAVSETPSSPFGPAQPSHDPTQPVQTTRHQPLTQSEEVPRSRVERVDSDARQQEQKRSTSLTDHVERAPTVQRAFEITREQNTSTHEQRRRRESEEFKSHSVQTTPQTVSEEPTVSRIAPPAIPKETTQSKPANAGTDQSVENIKREQALLQRKADAFMAGLFERRSSQAIQREENSEDAKQAHSYAEAPHEQPTRLPLPRPPQVTDAADEQPSLTIGKLTVEVMPSTPPPVNSTRQVVVVRGPATGRRQAGFSSSQRFGLGQF